MMNPMRILVRLVLNWKFLERISRCCATLSAMDCSCDITHSLLICCRYEWLGLFIRATLLLHMCEITHSCGIACDVTHSHAWHDAFTRAAWRIHMCDMTHSYVWPDAFICATWCIHMCGMTHSCVQHDAFIRVAWHIYVCNTTHSYVMSHTGVPSHMIESGKWGVSHMWMSHGHDWNEVCHTCEWVMVMTEMRYVTHVNESWSWLRHDVFTRAICVMYHVTYIWMHHVVRMNEAHVWYVWYVMDTSCMWCAMAHIHECIMLCAWMWHTCDMCDTSYVWYATFIRIRWCIHTCDMPHAYVRHHASACVT